jgi:hypothetical protein
MFFKKLLHGLFFLLLTSSTFAIPTAPVSGFAVIYPVREPLPNATITILENGTKFLTDAKGKFGPIYLPIGQSFTFVLEKKGFHTTQSATVTIPENGLDDMHHNIAFQVPAELTFYMMTAIIGAKFNNNDCHVVATVAAHDKVVTDKPQGEENAVVSLLPTVSEVPFYFGIFKNGPMKDETNPFEKGLTQTSLDGGVAFFNITPSDQPYTMVAKKDGVTFTEAKFICRKGMFINLSPPQGPIVI